MTFAEQITTRDLNLAHHATLHRLRAEAPVAWVPVVGGWVVTSRAEASEVMRDAATFTVDDPRFTTAQVIGPSMLSLDGDEHTRHRSPFAAAYQPGEITRRCVAIATATATRLVAEIAPRCAAELRRELAGPLAIEVVASSIGLEHLDPFQLRSWYDEIVAAVERISFGEPAGDAGAAAFAELRRAVGEALQRPDSVLRDISGELTFDEAAANVAVLLFGGIETGEGMIANLLFHLLSNPEQFDLVRNDPALIEPAIDESLRLEPAASRIDRYATCDVEIGGARVRAGDLVVVSLAAANRDPAICERPDVFDVRRANARSHVAFAHGPHACLGAQLARIEGRAVLEAVSRGLTGITLGEHDAPSGVVFRKPNRLHAQWSR